MSTSKQWKEAPDQVRAAMLKYRETDKYHRTKRNGRYLRLYGISLDDYNQLLESQNYCCKICHCPETVIGNQGNVKTLAVDHCHDTGKIRGLLCDRCNHLLGLAKDSSKVLLSAINYLKDSS